MKKHILISSLVFLICSVIHISSPAETKAASPQEEQSSAASFLQVKATGLETYGRHSIAEQTAGAGSVSHMVSMPVSRDMDAFVDFARSQEQTKKTSSLDFRPVFGFHITLK
jgi:hypothetical protein